MAMNYGDKDLGGGGFFSRIRCNVDEIKASG